MIKNKAGLPVLVLLLALPPATTGSSATTGLAAAQMTPWLQWTFLPQARMDEIIGEASGETALNHVMAMCGFPRDRKPAEYAGTFAEAQYVLDRLQEFGLAEAAILRYPGGQTWDGVKGELWEVKPGRQKLASFIDLTAMLASGSAPAGITAELVWVEEGEAKDFEGLDVKDKILVTSGSPVEAGLLDWAGVGNAEVPDPYTGGSAEFEHVWQLLDRAARGVIARLETEVARRRIA